MGTVDESHWEELHGILFAQAPVGVLLFDRDLRVKDVNAHLLGVLRTTRERILGVDLRALRDRRPLSTLERALAGESASYEGPYAATTSEAEVHVSVRTAPLRGRGREVVGGVAMVEDITERRAAEDALRRSEARFRGLIEAAPDATCLIVDGRFVYVNPALLAQLGTTEAEVLGRSVADVTHPDDRAELVARMGARMDGAPPAPFEYRGVRKDGSVFFVEVVSMRVDHEGRPALVAISRDVTARRAMQARLLQADRMLTMGTLAAGVAHEVANPLAYLAANLAYLGDKQLPAIAEILGRQRERLARLGDPQAAAATADEGEAAIARAQELLATAQKGAGRVREIVRDLRTFSRDDDARTRVDVRRVLDACVDLAEHELVGKARVVRDYAPTPKVLASESRLGQVFLNLLVNAAQAIPSGSPSEHTIAIRTGADAHGRAVVSVSDTGAGMPPGVRERIFEPFFTTKPAGVGTGLGLWIVADIVQRTGARSRSRASPARAPPSPSPSRPTRSRATPRARHRPAPRDRASSSSTTRRPSAGSSCRSWPTSSRSSGPAPAATRSRSSAAIPASTPSSAIS